MRTKKFLAAILSAVMIFSIASIPAFAAGVPVLSASKTEVVSGDTFTITLSVPSDNTTVIGAFDADLNYNKDTFEFVSATSDFGGFMANDVDTEGIVKTNAVDALSTKSTGNLFAITFRVKAGALGGTQEFSIPQDSFHVDNINADPIYDSSVAARIATSSVTVKAPEKLAAPAVSIDAEAKKASWVEVENAKTYNVVLKKGENEVYNKDITALEFDFAKYVTETAEYTVTVIANQNGSMYLTSDAGSATERFVVAPTVTPTEKDYIKGSGGFEVTMTLNGNTFTGITGLTVDSDYTVNGNVVKINDSALIETKQLTFNFSDDQTAAVNVTVKDAATSATLVLAERSYKLRNRRYHSKRWNKRRSYRNHKLSFSRDKLYRRSVQHKQYC